MFADACETAQKFTRAVVVSVRRRNGECASSVGSFVCLNADGWILTAAHILKQLEDCQGEMDACGVYESERRKIDDDSSLKEHQKKSKRGNLRTPPKTAIDKFSPWWSEPSIRLVDAHVLGASDLAVGKLTALPPGVTEFPKLKDPSKPMRVGTSLCRLGFPFPEVTPVFHEDKDAFELPPDTAIIFFPIEGILTRKFRIQPPSDPAPAFQESFIETSSPGLRGQSGGPLFDKNGTVWGIQSMTRHLPLGFDAKLPNRKEPVPQFINPGYAVSADTIVPFLRQLGVSFDLATY
jgi:hypothetical protein